MTTLEEIGMTAVLWERSSKDCGAAGSWAWPTGSPGDVGLDGAALESLTDLVLAGDLQNLHSILVVRHGKLVFERYFSGADTRWSEPLGQVAFGPETLHDARSVTKSVVGALVGIAHGEGLIGDLDEPIVSFFPEYAARHESALEGRTLRHALTMTAGLSWDESTYPYWDARNDENGLWRADDPLEYALSRDPVTAPGATFAYNGGLPTVLAAVVERTAGVPLADYARERLWCPLGVTAAEWIQHRSGMVVAASGLRLKPRDFARFGQMMLEGGRVSGSKVVPADYVAASLSAHVPTGADAFPAYGYQWWIAASPMASGNGGQRVLVDRGREIVVVVTAGNYDLPTQGDAPTRAIEAVLMATT